MEGAAQTMLSNAGLLLSGEYRLLSGVSSEVGELRDDLATMNALLRMQSEAEDGAADHFVREWMKQLRELAYDSEDCVDHYKLRIKSRPNDGVRARLERLFGTLLARRRLACEVRALRARAIAISERHARYGVNREALRRPLSLSLLHAPVAAPAHPNGADRHRLVGIADQAHTLAARLKDARAGLDGELMAVFSVVGFGGLGKTTLAMEVCRQLEADFPFQAMVPVSQAFEPTRDLKPLLKRVLRQVVNPTTANERGIHEMGALSGIDDLNDSQLATRLHGCLNGRRYLIVIDDVWTVKAWDALKPILPENKCGSRVIVTTRSQIVAKACSPASVNEDYIYQIEPLQLEDSKKLFLSRAFGSMDAQCPDELKEAMESILRKCGRLPLAIVSIASVLAGYKSSESKGKWETICRSIGSQMESNPTLEGMRQIIELSYNHLPHELKACMMYFSIFPEDYAIGKERLLRRWIAEGLVAEKRGMTMLEVAESYLEELLSRNVVEPDRFNYTKMEHTYKVHDILLEVMVSKSLEFNFVSLLGGQYEGLSYDRIRRLSVHGAAEKRVGQGRGSGHGTEQVNPQHVRSLTMLCKLVEGHKLLDQLGKFTLLRVLDLEDCEGVTDKHVSYACQLYLLKFLSLRGTSISKVPPHVGKLEHLQTFDVRDTCLDGLPETITSLGRLERLQFSNKTTWRRNGAVMWRLPRGLSKMKALHDMGVARLGNNAGVVREMGELEQLQQLSLYVDPDSEQDVLQELASSLSKQSYSLQWLIIGDIGNGKKLNFLHSIQSPPRHLVFLKIDGAIDELPSWVGSLACLDSIHLRATALVDDQLFGVLCKLPNLKSIWLECISYNSHELVARTAHNFPALTALEVTSDHDRPKIFRFEQGSMTKLETLKVNFADKPKSIHGIEHLNNLKVVQLMGTNDNPWLNRALDQLKAESRRRPESSQFQVAMRLLHRFTESPSVGEQEYRTMISGYGYVAPFERVRVSEHATPFLPCAFW